MLGKFVAATVTLALNCGVINAALYTDSNPLMTAADIANKHGYNATTHWFTTHDGYILNVNHIAHVNPEKDAPPKGVIVFLSGWLGQAANMLVNTEASGNIPYFMASSGYSVWLMNHRNKPWPNHTRYSAEDAEIWDYNNKDMIYTDIPAALTFIQGQEGGAKMSLLGQSRGGYFSSYFATDDRAPSLLNAVVLLGGATPLVKPKFLESLSHLPAHLLDPFKTQMESGDEVGTAAVEASAQPCIPCGPKGNHWKGCCGGLATFRVPDPYVHPSDITGGSQASVCEKSLSSPITRNLCPTLLHLLCGGTAKNDPARMPAFFAHYPSYESVNTANVLDLEILDTDKVKVPVIMFEGGKDKFVQPLTSEYLADALRKSGKLAFYDTIPGYGHLDELGALDCGTQVGARLVRVLDQDIGSD